MSEVLKTYLICIPQDKGGTAAAFEQVFIQLHETLRREKISFEILATGQNIAFCFTGAPAVVEVVTGQIYAVTPEAYIKEIADFTKSLGPEEKFSASEVGLVRSDIYPLKDYREFEGDSLAGLLSVLSKCVPGERMFVQIVCKPAADSWDHQMRMASCRKWDRIRQFFRFKYWFKREVAKTFREKTSEKTAQRMFRVNIRLGCASSNPRVDSRTQLTALMGAYSVFNTLDYNQLRFSRERTKAYLPFFNRRVLSSGFLLSVRELATMFHLPCESEIPNVVHVLSKKEAPPTNLPTDRRDPDISFFGATNFRGQKVPFGIKWADRRRHMYVVGKSGSGKSKLLELLIRNDIIAGKGVGVLDPHGDLVDNVLKTLPRSRLKDVVIFDPSDLNFPASFNPLEQVPEALKMRVTIGFIEIFKKLFGTNWSPRLEHVLRYTTLALLDTPGTTVLSILKMLSDKNYRQMIVRGIKDNVVKNFWVNEFAGWSEKFDNEAITPLLNKVGQFVATNMIRNIVGQPINKFDFRNFMDNRKIMLMKVSKGILGEENASLLGAIVVTKIYQAAMARADTAEDKRVDFYFYVDEFQNFATDTFGEILSEARKYRLNLTIANQFLGQLDTSIRKTVFGNVGTMVSFRLGSEDAEIMAGEFSPRFSARDIINLGVREFCLKMSVDGEIKEAFSGQTLTMKFPEKDVVQESIEYSRQTYARPLAEVEDILRQWEESKYTPSQQLKPPVPNPQATLAGAQTQTPAPASPPEPPASPAFAEEVEFEEPLI